MGNFREKLARFMYGRYGLDNFSRILSWLGLIVLVLGRFIAGGWLSAVGIAIFAYAYYRVFSRNIEKRRAENTWFTNKIYVPVTDFIRRQRSMDRKNYTYFRCPKCRKSMRAPKGRGRIRITCHDCGTVFEKNV